MSKTVDMIENLAPKKCHTCNGHGRYTKYVPMPSGTLQKVEVLCQMCDGKGFVDMIDEINTDSKYRV